VFPWAMTMASRFGCNSPSLCKLFRRCWTGRASGNIFYCRVGPRRNSRFPSPDLFCKHSGTARSYRDSKACSTASNTFGTANCPGPERQPLPGGSMQLSVRRDGRWTSLYISETLRTKTNYVRMLLYHDSFGCFGQRDDVSTHQGGKGD